MNYYPPCSQADKVVGLYPHSDADLLTVVLQVNHVHGLQIKRNGSWLPVRPVEGAFVVNIGDIFEILTNGYRRSSTAWSWTPRRSGCRWPRSTLRATIGPLKELIVLADGEDEAYATVEHERFRKLFFETKLEGKSFMDRMKLK